MAASRVKDPALQVRRAAIGWAIVFTLLIAAFFITIGALNSSLYSAPGFVGSYLDALARHDVTEAMSTPGVALADNASGRLLTGAALGTLSDIRLVSDTSQGAEHRVVFSYRLGSTQAQTQFRVQPTGQRFGMFPTWRFATSPISIITITALHDSSFTVNGMSVVSVTGQGKPTPYQVLTPGLYELGHKSTYLTAQTVAVPVVTVGSMFHATVNVQASPAFVTEVEKQVHSYLDKCATQQVLQPTGCPFGYQTGNRIVGLPVWSMSRYPVITIVPGTTPGTWLVPQTTAAAHLKVRIQSLFDGTISPLDKDIPFSMRYVITLGAGNSMQITAQ